MRNSGTLDCAVNPDSWRMAKDDSTPVLRLLSMTEGYISI